MKWGLVVVNKGHVVGPILKVLRNLARLWVVWRWGADRGEGTAHHDLLRGRTMRSWAWFWRVGESESRGIDDSITSHKGDGDLGGLANPQPFATKGGNVGDDAEHALLTTEHCFRLNVAKPDA